MATTISDRLSTLKTRARMLPVVVRRFHRVVAALWILSFALSAAVSATGGQLPGPSIPGLSFIAVILTGSYLLLRPWVRGDDTAADRWNRLTDWDTTRPVLIRRTHRIGAALWLLSLAVALVVQGATGSEPQLLLVPVAGLLVYLAITGTYMLLRPWAARFRAR